MERGLLATIFGEGSAGESGAESFYECTGCGSTFEAWPTVCPDCGQLVVRIVAPCTSGRV